MPKIGGEVALMSRQLFFPLTLVVLTLMSQMFFSAYPYDDLCRKCNVTDVRIPSQQLAFSLTLSTVTATGTNVTANSHSEYMGTSTVQPAIKNAPTHEAVVYENDPVYTYCDQDFLSRLGDLFNFLGSDLEDWMDMSQELLTFSFGIGIVAIIAITCVINFRENIETSRAYVMGGYVS